MLQVMHCVVLVTFAQERKRNRTTVQADSQGHVSHYRELMSRVWPVNAYFLMQPATMWNSHTSGFLLSHCVYIFEKILH